jgi:hypothetical protein
MNSEEIRDRQLVNWIIEQATSISNQRQEESAKRQRVEMQREQAEYRRQLIIQCELLRREIEQRKYERVIEERESIVKAASAEFQRRQEQYFVNLVLAPTTLQMECKGLDDEWNQITNQCADPETRQKFESVKEQAVNIMKEMKKRALEEKLRKEANACFLSYYSTL